MNKKSLDISKKIDPFTLEILSIITDVSNKLNIDFFIIGASARDIIFEYVYTIKPYRITNDIDFGINVRSWEDFDLLVDKLLKKGFYKLNENHKFGYKGLPGIDIIPFGKISSDKSSIKWQGKNGKEMSVLGYDEAFSNTEIVRISKYPELTVNVISSYALVLLKLISWNETFPAREKDAQDIYFIIQNYLNAGNNERLFLEHSDIVKSNFDYELAGTRLLGRDIGLIGGKKIIGEILFILNEKSDKLIYDMMKGVLALESGENKFEHFSQIIVELRNGLMDIYNTNLSG